MTAKIIEFRKQEGPLTRQDAMKAEIRREFARRFNRPMPDSLLALFAGELGGTSERAAAGR